MKSPYVRTLAPNEPVTAYFLVLSKEVRQKKTGEPYLSLHLGDRTGDIEAKMWDNVAEVMDSFDRDDFVKVKGLMQLYQNRSQFTIHRLRKMEDHEVDFDDFFPCTERDPQQMFGELERTIASLGNPHLRTLLQMLFADPEITRRYRIAPAAKTIHHACRGGLLEHVLSLCTLCRTVGPHYPSVDVDLLLTGAIVHDIGKIEELTYTRSFGYSPDGQLLGHIIIGLRMVGDVIARIPDFPAKLRTLVEHMIISHHGELEFGSPKVPLFEEAMLLHHLDNLDSKMEAFKSALRKDTLSAGEFTGWVSALERSLLRKDRYLAEASPPLQVRVPAEFHGSDMDEELPRVTPPAHAPEVSKPREEKREQRPAPISPFAEKLQAVLHKQP